MYDLGIRIPDANVLMKVKFFERESYVSFVDGSMTFGSRNRKTSFVIFRLNLLTILLKKPTSGDER
jgi:hypothetical protein